MGLLGRRPCRAGRVARLDGPFRLNREEIDDGRFWELEEIASALGQGLFTPNLELEFAKLGRWISERRDGRRPR